MNEQAMFETYQEVVVPEPVLLKVERKNRYGSVAGLDDEELATPEELERNIIRNDWGPVLALPIQGRKDGFKPDVDEDGVVFGAFGSVDFYRIKPGFNKVQYKADKIREQLKDVIIMFEMVRERLPRRPASLVLKYLRMGIIDLECISNFDMWSLARFYLRAKHLRKQGAELEETSWQRKQRKHQAWLDSLG